MPVFTRQVLPSHRRARKARKWLRVMADYEACGLWQSPGIEADLETLPLSAKLVTELQAWSALFPSFDAELDNMGDIHTSEGHQFIKTGLHIAQQIKAELPDYTVLYFDALKAQHASIEGKRLNRTLYEFEIY